MIQIATLGDTPVVVKEGLRKIIPEKLYIIHTPNEKERGEKKQYEILAKKLKKEIQNDYNIPIELLSVGKYESDEVIQAILSTISKERRENSDLEKKDFVINITGGTKAMVAGAACAAYLAQTRMYYVLHPEEAKGTELVRELPVPSRAENTPYGKTAKTTSIVIEELRDLGETNNQRLLTKLEKEKFPVVKKDKKGKKTTIYKKFTGQILTYHLNKLEEAGLITKERGWKTGKKIDRKLNTIKLTETGKHYADYPDVIGEVL